MPTHWMPAYITAMRDRDPAKLEDLYEQARRAIHSRVLELEDTPADIRERGELEEALRQLTLHRYK